MTRPLDPDRSPPRFWPFPIDIDTSVCSRCSSMVPATDKAQEVHRDHHAAIDAVAAGFAIIALTHQLSDPGSRGTPPATADVGASPGSASTPGSGEREDVGSHLHSDRHDPDPGPNVPTPPEEATAGPGGVEDANQDSAQADAAGLPLGGVTAPPAASPPAAGGTKRVGRGSGGTGDSSVSAPADTLFEPAPVWGYPGRFAR